jgi:methyl-accepting chemotaxis protein
MSVIQNFKKRQAALAIKNSRLPKTNTNTAMPNVKPHTALKLLAQLLQVNENIAIETAEKYIASNITYFADFATEQDKTVSAIVETNQSGDITKITEIEEHEAIKEELADSANELAQSADELANSANNVESAASSIETSAEQANSAADNLAYSVDDISSATEQLKEATAEIKKPQAPRKSSTLKRKTPQPKSSKK